MKHVHIVLVLLGIQYTSPKKNAYVWTGANAHSVNKTSCRKSTFQCQFQYFPLREEDQTAKPTYLYHMGAEYISMLHSNGEMYGVFPYPAYWFADPVPYGEHTYMLLSNCACYCVLYCVFDGGGVDALQPVVTQPA